MEIFCVEVAEGLGNVCVGGAGKSVRVGSGEVNVGVAVPATKKGVLFAKYQPPIPKSRIKIIYTHLFFFFGCTVSGASSAGLRALPAIPFGASRFAICSMEISLRLIVGTPTGNGGSESFGGMFAELKASLSAAISFAPD